MNGAWTAAPPRVLPPGGLPPGPPGNRIKVLHVVTKLVAGAGGNTLVSAVGMDRERYEVWVAGSGEGDLWPRAAAAGVRTIRLRGFERAVSPRADLRILLQLIRLIRRERFAILHAHNAKGGLLGRLAGRLCGTPVIVYTLHGRDPWWPVRDAAAASDFDDLVGPVERRAYLALERCLRGITDGFVAVSPQIARSAVEARIARPGSVDVAPSAIELDRIPRAPDPRVREELGIPAGAPLVGTSGRLDPQKAPLDFVRMAARVRGVRPDARFVWVGEGELAPQVQELAVRLGVPVTITGFRDDAPRVVSAFDVYVVASRFEGVGRSLTEALAAGRPVVATAVDGVPDLVEHGSTGLLVPPRDAEALAAGVLWMLDHPIEAAAMGEQGRRRVEELFDPAVMCAALDRLYCRLLGLSAPAERPVPARTTPSEGSGGVPVPAASGAAGGER